MIRSTFTPSLLGAEEQGEEIELGGRVVYHAARESWIADARARVRVCFHEPSPLAPGAFVVIRGTLVMSDQGAQVLDAELLWQRPTLALPHGEFSRLSDGLARRLGERARAETLIRDYFRRQRFLEVNTPARVNAPGTDVYIEPIASESMWLVTSPEFHMKRLLAGGLPRVFQIARCWRRDEQGPWHEPEFTLLEWYRAFADSEQVRSDTEQIVAMLAAELGEGTLTIGGQRLEVHTPFEVCTIREVYREFGNENDAADLAASDEDRYFEVWVNHIEPHLRRIPRPLFLTEYPITQAALAQPLPTHPELADRFELFVAGVELCNGYGELTDPDLQRQRFASDVARRRDKGLPVLPVDERLLDALDEGMPPAAGNALGLDRLIALCLGVTVKETLAFPGGG